MREKTSRILTGRRLAALALGLSLLCACSGKSPAESAGPTPEPTPAPTAAASTPAPAPTPAQGAVEARVSMLKGPTGLGAAKLMEDEDDFAYQVFAEPTQAVAALTSGEVDIAALPTNLAATLYHKLDGGVQLLCLNTLGVLYILENGESVHSLADLEGKTIYATGQGANPEYVLNYLLTEYGLFPGEDVEIVWMASDELAAAMAAGDIDLCMLPVPAATSVMLQNSGVRAAIDLNDAWDEAGAQGVLTMGCVVVRTEFAQADPGAVEEFLDEYEDSIEFMSDPEHLDEAAALAERFEIVPKAAVAKKALPDANLCFITGEDMVADIQGYYQVLYEADPAAIGGSIPDGAFYYGMKF